MFPRVEYVHWIRPRIEAAAHDLGSSDLRPELGDGGRVVPPRLADLPTPEADLRTLVAEAYGVDAERVLVTPGATAANLIAAAVALGEEEVRVSLGGPPERAEEALSVFGEVLDGLG